MKTTIILIFVALMLSSCGRDKGIDRDLLAKAEKADEIYAPAAVDDAGDYYYGDWGEETRYDVPDTSVLDGIVTSSGDLSGYYDGKYYFSVKKARESTKMYIDLATGESHYVCPDPLCPHTKDADETCGAYSVPGMNIREGKGYDWLLTSDKDTPWIQTFTLTERDLTTGKVRALYSYDSNAMEEKHALPAGSCIDGNLLWFTNREFVTDAETKTQTQHDIVYTCDLTTGEISEPYHLPDEYDQEGTGILWVQDGLFYMRSPQTKLFVTDQTFTGRRVLIDEPVPANGREQINYRISDENTGEVFLLYGNKAEKTGTIYRICDGEIEELSMPHNEIYTFRLTKDKIYYMTYEESEYSAPWQEHEYGGGKIYVTDRETRETAELFFDSKMQIPLIDSWYVVGNYVYVTVKDYTPNGDHPFSTIQNLKTARIHVTDGTIRYFCFE